MKGQLKVTQTEGIPKRKTKGYFYGEQPIEVAFTIIIDLFNDVTKTENIKSN
jgi:hypothetical protein